MDEYFCRPSTSRWVRSARSAPSVSAAAYRYSPCPASSCTLASRIALRRSDGARVIQLPSGCIPMISECACWAIWRTNVLRYCSGIQSRGSIRSLRAMVSSNCVSSSPSVSVMVVLRADYLLPDRSGISLPHMADSAPLLASYASGAWFRATDEGTPLRDAATGEEVARLSSTGLDLAAMTDHARSVGGPAVRSLTFHERAALLKAVAKA